MMEIKTGSLVELPTAYAPPIILQDGAEFTAKCVDGRLEISLGGQPWIRTAGPVTYQFVAKPS